ncbi:MAG: 2-isopropylmalate synthase [Alteromonadaceae bacterium]|nr:MAG: 2-isopropylmalate synthase [Alteromonadaceae bacterium]
MKPFNHTKYKAFPFVNKADRQWPSKQILQAPTWCAVDLRDGNQALIEPMSVKQKQGLWGLLVKTGFKQIEIGFPSASQEDFDFCRWLIEKDQIPEDVSIQVLVQARDALIERTYEALIGVKQAIVHVYNSTSPVQREKVFKMGREGIIDIARRGAQKVKDEAAKYPEVKWTFQYSPESFSSTEEDFAIDICNAVIGVWQPRPEHKVIINLPATVECSTPNIFADQIERFCEQVNQRDAIEISLHTHNDRGCAVAAAELGLMAGADRIEGTLMGNGERTGNMDIITMAMNLYSQGIDPMLDFSNVDEIVRVVSECTQIQAHPRHPWVGELVYTAFSGSHQDAIRKCLALQAKDKDWDVAYLPIDPSDLGRDYQSVIRVNSQSGKGGVAYILEQNYSLRLPRWLQIEVSTKVQAYAEQSKSEVGSEQIWQIVKSHYMPPPTLRLKSYQVNKNEVNESITATLEDAEKTYEINGAGDGTLSAFCQAIESKLSIKPEIVHYDQHAIAEGTDAKAVAYIQAIINGKRYSGIGKSTDVLSASIHALLICINKAMTDD